MKRVLAMALVAICAAQAAFARDTVYSCTFKPGPWDYWIPSTLTITDPGPGSRPMVWDEMIEKAVGRPVVAEAKVNKSRRTYVWELGPVDTSAFPLGSDFPSSRLFYSVYIGSDHRATLRQDMMGVGTLSNKQLFGFCTVRS